MGSSSSKFKKYLLHGDEYAAMQVYQSSNELRRALDPNHSYGDQVWTSNVIKTFHDYFMHCLKLNVTPILGDFRGRVGIYRFLQSPSIPRLLPSLFICWDFFSFCPFNRVCARLQARGLAQGTAMSACTRLKGQKEN